MIFSIFNIKFNNYLTECRILKELCNYLKELKFNILLKLSIKKDETETKKRY